MSRSDPRARRLVSLRAWTLLLCCLSAGALTTLALAVQRPDSTQLQLAPGVVGGMFHPIAGNFKPDATNLNDCGSHPRCLEQGFGNLAYAEGPKRALRLFERQQTSVKAVAIHCHTIAHMIGSAALAYFKGNVAKAYSKGSASCASGYYHGILERAFARVSTTEGLARVARSLCRDVGIRRRGFLDYQCVHGLGHGLMIQTGYDLPTALSVCRRLQTRWDDVSCTGGAFMENGSTVYGLRSRWLKDDEPLFPCSHVGLNDRASCYLRVTTQILKTNRYNWPETAASCRALATRWSVYCYRSFGRDAVSYAGGRTEPILRLCRLSRPMEGQCLYGAARTLADRDGSAIHASEFCRRADSRTAGFCFAGLGVVVGLLHSSDNERSRSCRLLAGAHAGACTRAAVAEVSPDGRGAWG